MLLSVVCTGGDDWWCAAAVGTVSPAPSPDATTKELTAQAAAGVQSDSLGGAGVPLPITVQIHSTCIPAAVITYRGRRWGQCAPGHCGAQSCGETRRVETVETVEGWGAKTDPGSVRVRPATRNGFETDNCRSFPHDAV